MEASKKVSFFCRLCLSATVPPSQLEHDITPDYDSEYPPTVHRTWTRDHAGSHFLGLAVDVTGNLMGSGCEHCILKIVICLFAYLSLDSRAFICKIDALPVSATQITQ